MASAVDICNSALNMIGASTILALNEDSKAGRICNQRYGFVRDSVFRAHPFCLRVLKLSDPEIKFEIEGRKLLCDESTINLIFVARVIDPNEYDQLLINTIESAIAADIAYALIGSTTLTATMHELYRKKLTEARFVDATEGNTTNTSSIADSDVLAANTFINARL